MTTAAFSRRMFATGGPTTGFAVSEDVAPRGHDVGERAVGSFELIPTHPES